MRRGSSNSRSSGRITHGTKPHGTQ
jgi:hypothetical protein